MGTQNIEALTFDVGGTVFDWQTAVRTELTAICDERGVNIDVPQFALDWRRHFFEILGEVRHGDRDHAGADALQLASARCATPLCCLRTWRPGLSDRTDREFLIDYGFSVADIKLGYSLHLANDRVPFDDLVHAKAYYDRLAARPAFQRAL